MTTTEAIPAFLDYLRKVARRSPHTISAYRYDLMRFVRFSDACGLSHLAAVDPPLVENWMASMHDLSDATVRRALNSLSGLFKWAMRFGHAQANPLDLIERPKKRHRIQLVPKPHEVQALLDATKGLTERSVLLLMATSGLRRTEVLALNWSDVDLSNRRLRIQGKGDKQREVLIFDELLPVLYALQSQGACLADPVNRGRQGRPLQLSTLNRWFRRWIRDAGLTSSAYTLHSLRRFAAKSWLNSGLNIRQVQLLLGHEELQTTILYLNYDLDEIARSASEVSFGFTPAD